MYITFTSAKANKAEPTLALKPKQGYQWPQNRICECVRQKHLTKKIITYLFIKETKVKEKVTDSSMMNGVFVRLMDIVASGVYGGH